MSQRGEVVSDHRRLRQRQDHAPALREPAGDLRRRLDHAWTARRSATASAGAARGGAASASLRESGRDRHGFPEFNLFPHLTARRERHARSAQGAQASPRREAPEIADRWLGRVGLADKRDSLPAELSGGQQQRVGIARAVAMEPKICCSTRSPPRSTPNSWARCWASCCELADEGMTMIVVTHEMAFARDISGQGRLHGRRSRGGRGHRRRGVRRPPHERLRSFLSGASQQGGRVEASHSLRERSRGREAAL